MHPNTCTGTARDDAPLVEARGLTKRYDGFSLEDVCLTVGPGEVVGFVGKNGAGKSTTIKCLLGLVAPDAGEARVLGAAPRELQDGTRADASERIGVVLDAVALPGHLRVADVARLMARCYASWDAAAFAGLAREFDLADDRRVKELSRGTGMKLSLACALAHDPTLLILDEATAGLDPMARNEVLGRLCDFVADGERGILMSSHITTDLDKIADTVVGIDAGRIAFALPKDQICDQMGIARCRMADLEAICASGVVAEKDLVYVRHEYGIDVLVPDRFAFARRLPQIACDRMTIDDYLALTLKGADIR